MISSVEITRFRGIREGKLEGFAPLVVLVGPNGSGKSSLLDGLLAAGSRPVKDGIVQAIRRHAGLQYGARWLFWKPSHKESCQIKIATSDSGERACVLTPMRPGDWDSFPVRCEIQEVFDAHRAGDLVLEFGRRNEVQKFTGRGPGTPLEVFAGVRLVESHREDPTMALHDLVTAATEVGAIDQVVAILADLIPGAKDIRILTESSEPLVHIVYGDHSVPAALAGDGIYSLLRLSLELASRAEGTILLEEPEVHQHPGAVRQTMRAVLAAVRRDIQVILSTHSLELIDSLLAESSDEDLERLSLYRLQLEDGVLRSRRMSGSEVAFARTEIENDLR